MKARYLFPAFEVVGLLFSVIITSYALADPSSRSSNRLEDILMTSAIWLERPELCFKISEGEFVHGPGFNLMAPARAHIVDTRSECFMGVAKSKKDFSLCSNLRFPALAEKCKKGQGSDGTSFDEELLLRVVGFT